jgi:hypothetical protein
VWISTTVPHMGRQNSKSDRSVPNRACIFQQAFAFGLASHGRVCCVVVVVDDEVGAEIAVEVWSVVVLLVTFSELPQPTTKRVLVTKAAPIRKRVEDFMSVIVLLLCLKPPGNQPDGRPN